MSSILKALKKLEQNPNEGNPGIDLWQWKTDSEKAFGRGARRLRPRAIAFYVLFVSFLAVGGWLLLKYALLPAEKSQPGKPMPKAVAAISINMPAGVAPVPEKTDSETKANSTPRSRINTRKEKAAGEKTAVTSRTGVEVPEKKDGKLPAVVNRTGAKTQLKPSAEKPGIDSKSFQTTREPVSASGSPSQRRMPVLNNDDKAYPPPGRSYQPQAADKPAVVESSIPTGFSVQAIAWSKIPAERIAVINGMVMREGGFVEGVQVTHIGMDEVSLKKGDKTWRLQCGR